MPKEYVNPNSLFPSLPHGFSQVVIASGRKMVFVSGQTAWDARKNIVGGDSVLEQARQAFRNLTAGGTLKRHCCPADLRRGLSGRERNSGGDCFKRILSCGKSAGEYMDRRLGAGRSRIPDRD